MFESAVAELGQKGATLEPHEYVVLYHAAEKTLGDECPAFIEIPVVVGNVTLWPLTIGAALWWKEKGDAWYGDDKSASVLALAYVMAHSKDAEAFKRLSTKGRADWHLVAWQATIGTSCTLSQLAWGIDKVLGQYDWVEINSVNERKVQAASATDWGDIIAKLCAAYHQPPEYFLWGLSEKASMELLAKAPSPFEGKTEDVQKQQAMAEFFELKRHYMNKEKAA